MVKNIHLEIEITNFSIIIDIKTSILLILNIKRMNETRLH